MASYRPPVTRSRLHQHSLFQAERLKLQRIVKENIAAVKALLEIDSDNTDVEERFERLERYFNQYLVANSKCQMLLDTDEPKFRDITEELDRSVNMLKRRIIDRSSNDRESSAQNKTYHVSPSAIGSQKSTSSVLSIKEAKVMELARLRKLKLEQQYISRKKQAEVEAELLENELQIAIAESKLDVLTKAEDPQEIEPKVPLDGSYVANYVLKHSISDEQYLVPEPHPPPGPKPVKRPHYSERSSRYSPSLGCLKSVLGRFESFANPRAPSVVHSYCPLSQLSVCSSSSPRFGVLPQSTKLPTPNLKDQPNTNLSETSSKQEASPAKVENPYHVLSELIGYLQAPEADIDPFRGNPLEFEFFMAAFHETVERKIKDPRGRLTRLLQYLRGEPKELVKGCIHLPADEGFDQAIKLLKKRYGDPFRVYSEYMRELEKWPKIKPNDGQAFRKFHSFLIKFKSTTECHKSSRESSPEVLQSLSKKIPTYLQNRWGKIVLNVRKVHKEVTLDHFIQLIEDESTVVNDPLFSNVALSDSKTSETRKKSSLKANSNKFVNKSRICAHCKQSHDLDDCPDFKKLPIEERREFVFRHRLCFGCLKRTSSNHSAKTCNNKKKCSICERLHPSSLHDYYQKEDELKTSKDDESDKAKSVTNGCVNSNVDASIGLCIVRVKISLKKDCNSSVETFALLDTGSQGTFIDEDVLQDLDVTGLDTTISVKTIHGERTDKCKAIEGLVVSPTFNDTICIPLPRTYSQSSIPVDDEDIPTKERVSCWKHLEPIVKFLPSSGQVIKVGLLIGSDCPKALEPHNTISSKNNGPFALKTRLGWCVSGPLDETNISSKTSKNLNRIGRPTTTTCCFQSRTEVKEIDLTEMMLCMYRHDFNEAPSRCESTKSTEKQNSYSQEDKKFMTMMENECQFVDGQYVLPLPFRNSITLPNNRNQAVQRANHLKRKLQKNDKFFNDYKNFMSTILDKGYAVPCRSEPVEGKAWYIPHHGVYHPRKPSKIRVVFDCSAKFKNVSLNGMLLQGPDLTNKLVGVLSRFRKEQVIFFGDIEKMFYRVKVPEEQQDYLRFLWWQDGNLDSEIREYRMTVHLFGAISSPSCANFALLKTADDNVGKYDPEVTSILKKSFYVDDLLESALNEARAGKMMWETKANCNDGGFNLIQLGSTSREIIDTIPEEDRMKGIKTLDSSTSTLPVERVLGVSWCIENDEFNFRIILKDKPLSRRGILSSVSSIYDPLGFAAPVMLLIKRLLQKLIKDGKGWDEEISSEERVVWEKWRSNLPSLESVSIRRCFKPKNFGKVVKATAHHFSDGSSIGYGQCSYLQLIDDHERISVNFLMGKSRVAPLKQITIPRMELTAALTSIKVSNLLHEELMYEPSLEHVFWTDSQVVLGYINNETKAFHIFVSNRIQAIRNDSDRSQWHYVSSKENTSDIGSRGIAASKLAESGWLQGPDFLTELPKQQPTDEVFEVSPDDPEVKKKVKILVIKRDDEEVQLINKLMSRTNSWLKLRRIVAWILKWTPKTLRYPVISMADIQQAGERIIKLVQRSVFSVDIIAILKEDQDYKGQLSSLNPFVDTAGILRVGGRLRKSNLNKESCNPIILPKKHPLSKIILTWYHNKVAHCGRGITMNAVRSAGYWIINLNSLTRSIIRSCFKCRYNRGKCSNQLMADLPTDRTESVPPFTYVGVDMFGPFQVKDRRATIKKFVSLFTCLNSRAVHFESSSHMDTDSFIMMLRRLIARRGNVRLLRSDNGTNFVGCDNELQRAVDEMDEEKITAFLQQQGGDWMKWKRNPPASSHMGGAWERLIRSARLIFSSLLKNHGLSLNNEAFQTLLTEIESIINSRPLTVDTLSDGVSELPLSPMNLLTMKNRVVLPPPGNYSENDLYSRKRWRRVQHIANEFWGRWRKEYLQALQKRSKWQHKVRNFSIGDVVLLKESNFRNDWQLARVIDVNKDDTNTVRSCKVKTSVGIFARPIHKLVLLIEAEADEVIDKPNKSGDERSTSKITND